MPLLGRLQTITAFLSIKTSPDFLGKSDGHPCLDAEEYAIDDFEGYGSYRLDEYQGLEQGQKVAFFRNGR